MGTVLGALFIVFAAATGIFVGTRPTVMDGRWLSSKLEQSADGVTFMCQRDIPVGVDGAEFVCVQERDGARQSFRFRMNREGKFGPVGAEGDD
jgi:hypothetical protein